MNNEMFCGATYKKGHINTQDETVPGTLFNTFPGESLSFERQEYVRFNSVVEAIRSGIITELDKNIIKTVAVFAPGFILGKTVRERLALQNIPISDYEFSSSVRRLHQYRLLDFARIVKSDGKPLPNRLITLTQLGYQFSGTLGVRQRFNAFAISAAKIYEAKAYGEGAQLLTNIQKHIEVDSFDYRPLIKKNADEGAIVRPTFSVELWGETLYCEVVRKYNGWIEHITDKLRRYSLVFDFRPTVILCCENEEMSAKTAAVLASKELDMDILFTHDTASFGPEFDRFLYSFDKNGCKQIYQILYKEEAVG